MLVSGCDEFVTARGRTTGISTQEYHDVFHPEGIEEPVALPARALPHLAPRNRGLRRRAFALPRPRPRRHDRALGQPGDRGADAAGAAPPRLPRPPPAADRDGRLGRFRRGARRDVVGASRFPTCPGSSCAESSPRRGATRPGTAGSGTPRRPPAATTARKTSGARSSGSGRCAPMRRPSRSSRSTRSRAIPTASWTPSDGGGRHFAPTGDSVFDELARRSEAFVAESDHRRTTMLAGYPWLADWGRQAMIAAPGLALAQGRAGALARVLNTFAADQRDGLIPGHLRRRRRPAGVRLDRRLPLVHSRGRVVRTRAAQPLAAVASPRRGARDRRRVPPRNALAHRRGARRPAVRRAPRGDR